MSGNLARRRMVKFMPADFKLTETRQPPLKDQYDEWLARVICYAFSVPASAFVTQVNRATSQTLRTQAAQEGLVPLKAWVKSALDQVIQVCLKEPELEFAWVGDDAVDPLQQAQTLSLLVGAGIKTREEARAELGLVGAAKQVAKYNPYHDEQGRFTTPENAVEPGTHAKPDSGVEVAENENNPTMTDAGGGETTVAQGGVPLIEPMPEPEPVKPAEVAPATPEPPGAALAGSVAESVAPNDELPGVASKGLGSPRNMPPSDDPNATALKFATSAYGGQTPVTTKPIGDPNSGAFVAKMPDGSYITYRPAGQASAKTPDTTATVEINNRTIRALNNGNELKLKFPKR